MAPKPNWLPSLWSWRELSTPVYGSLARAAVAAGKLDQALDNNPLLPAILYRARLEAVRRIASSDGHMIDTWNFAASLEGMKFRMDGELRIIDRGSILDAVRSATEVYSWLVRPTDGQTTQIDDFTKFITQSNHGHALTNAAHAFYNWIDAGGSRRPAQAALVQYWTSQGLFRHPVPIVGASSFNGDVPWEPERWVTAFFDAIASESQTMLQMVYDFGRAWRTARSAIHGRRSDSRASAVIDIMAAAPVISAASLAGQLQISIKSALHLLEQLLAAGVVIELSHRAKRRLFALPIMAPLSEATNAPAARSTRKRGNVVSVPSVPSPPPVRTFSHSSLPPFKVDYSALEDAINSAEDVIQRTSIALNQIASGKG